MRKNEMPHIFRTIHYDRKDVAMTFTDLEKICPDFDHGPVKTDVFIATHRRIHAAVAMSVHERMRREMQRNHGA